MLTINISSRLADEIIDFADGSGLDSMDVVFNYVKDSADIFVSVFGHTKFFWDEPIHEFVALTTRNPKNSHDKSELHVRMTVNQSVVNLFSPAEIPLHELYHPRKCIAEASFPCYQTDPQTEPAKHSSP